MRRRPLTVLMIGLTLVVVAGMFLHFKFLNRVTPGYSERQYEASFSGLHSPEKSSKPTDIFLDTSVSPPSSTSTQRSDQSISVCGHPMFYYEYDSDPVKIVTSEPQASVTLRETNVEGSKQPENAERLIKKKRSIPLHLREINATDQDSSWSPETSTVSINGEEASHLSSSNTSNLGLTSTTEISYTDNFYNIYLDYNDYPLYKKISYTRVLFFCEYIFSAVYGEYSNFTDTVISYDNSSLAIITDQHFMDLCLPLYIAHYESYCIEKKLITICSPEEIAFLHNHGCQRPSSEDVSFEKLLASTLLEEDEVCFQGVCRGSVRVVERVAGDALVLLISPDVFHSYNGSCYKYVRKLYDLEDIESEGLYLTRNRHWPTCFPWYDVLWKVEPETLGMVRTWSYLPLRCRVTEGVLVALVMMIVVSGLTGNVLVVAVMIREHHLGEPSNILRTSLAIADLFVCLFVLLPSLDAHLSFMDDRNVESPWWKHAVVSDEVASQQEASGAGVVIDGGFWLFSALVLSSCSCISLLNLFALSLERFSLKSKVIQYKVVFTRQRARVFVAMTWMLSVLGSLALTYSEDGTRALWYPFYKLPLGVSPRGLETVLPAFVVSILGLVCLLTVVLSVLALHNYKKEMARRTGNLREFGETDVDQSTESSIQIITIMILMTISLLFSASLAAVALLLHIAAVSVAHMELVGYLCWWGFLAASSWNPWLYNMPSQSFRKEATALIKVLLPKRLTEQPWGQLFRRSRTKTTESSTDLELNISGFTKPKRKEMGIPGIRRMPYM